MKTWREHSARLAELFGGLRMTDERGQAVEIEEGFGRWRDWTLALSAKRGTVYLVGNGASASMASHFAADLAKNARLHTQVFSDLSLITAISNDMGYEHVFAEPLRRRAEGRDMLVTISSSGGSPNILAAAEVARELKMTVVTLTAMKAENPLRGKGRLNLYLPAKTYGEAETCHAAALHWWMDLVQGGANEK
jgi:D-sedoheptulose 7-phosphate isomerase